jgi:hypothetical protein
VVFNTAACSSANTIKTAEYAAIVVLVATLLGILLVAPGLAIVNVVNSVASIAAILLWFRRFGSFKFGDADYDRAKRDMRISLQLWVGLPDRSGVGDRLFPQVSSNRMALADPLAFAQCSR